MKRAELDQTIEAQVDKSKADPERFYKVVNVRPGRQEELRRLNYREEDASILESSLGMNATGNQFEMGKTKSQKAVVVSCPKVEWEARQQKEREYQDALLSQSIAAGAYEGQEQPKG